MLSLNDVFSEEELYDWENRIKNFCRRIPKLITFVKLNLMDWRYRLFMKKENSLEEPLGEMVL